MISPLEPYTTVLPLLIFPAEAPSNKLISSELDVTPPRIFNSVAEYENHLSDVYGRDIFYGDATLEALLEHTGKLADEIQLYITANQELTETELENTNA